jgi:hypothetical protein
MVGILRALRQTVAMRLVSKARQYLSVNFILIALKMRSSHLRILYTVILVN